MNLSRRALLRLAAALAATTATATDLARVSGRELDDTTSWPQEPDAWSASGFWTGGAGQ